MRRHANDCPVFWKDDKPCNCAMAELIAAEAEAGRLRAALEKYADTANWYVDREQGPPHFGWLGSDPTAIAQAALRPDDEQPAESEG